MQPSNENLQEGLVPPSLNGYTEFCEKNDLVDHAFPRQTSFCETSMINAAYTQSDQGRYKMSMMFVGDSLSALPCYFSSLGHEVWMIDPFLDHNHFDHQFSLKQKFNFIIIRDSFLRWHPQSNAFRMVIFVDSLPKLFFSDRKDIMRDSADTIALAKARSIKIPSGIVFFTVELVSDPEKHAQLFMDTTKRYYTFPDVKERLLKICDQVGSRFRDQITLHTSWIIR